MNEVVPFEEAQREAGKAFGKEVAQQALGFLGDILRPPAKELGGLLADHLKFFRFKTQIKILQRAKRLHNEHGISHQQIPLKIVASLLESCSWEEDEWMQTRWATLLANATKSGEKLDNYPMYIELLKQLSPLQAKCLDLMYSEPRNPSRRHNRRIPSYQSAGSLRRSIEVGNDELNVLLDGLIRLNLIQPEMKFQERSIGSSRGKTERTVERSLDRVSLTFLGEELVRRCRIPFSSIHRQKLRTMLKPILEELVKDRTGESLREFVRNAKEVYEYIDEEGAEWAVGHAIRWTLRKDERGHELDKLPLTIDQKNDIVERCLNSLERMYS